MSGHKGRVRFMDAGRGIAALLVLEHHIMVYFGERAGEVLGASTIHVLQFVSELNGAAVQFFFFLSGWAIYLALDQVRDSRGRIDWRLFAWHRGRRILPLYWIALLLSWALFVPAGQPNESSLMNLVGNLAFLQTPLVNSRGWFVPYAGNGPLWSLAYEAWYYAATPILCFAVLSAANLKSMLAPGLVLGALAISIVALAINQLVFFPLAVYAVLWPLWVAGFAFGATRGKLFEEGLLLLLAVSACVAIYVVHALVGSDSLRTLADGLAVVALAILAIMATSRFPDRAGHAASSNKVGDVAAILSRPVGIFVFLGSGSYALYVLHYPVLRWQAAYGISGYTVLLSIAVLVVATPFLERRVNRLIRRLPYPHAARPPRAVPPSSSPES
jgi:peptidoglycan/LPS O-acetylase OafA/YrhL